MVGWACLSLWTSSCDGECASSRPCVDELDCEGDEHCNTELSRCQGFSCASEGSACDSSIVCEGDLVCEDGACLGGDPCRQAVKRILLAYARCGAELSVSEETGGATCYVSLASVLSCIAECIEATSCDALGLDAVRECDDSC